ncbi:MAG: sigma-70 family RNA polymerase sigma factor, partial [Bacilli bacterium]|nr:sigma-70 family RNA polymerase sigma factor [Bacilli bacterium]
LEIPHIIGEEKPLKHDEQMKLFKRLAEIDNDEIIKRLNLANDDLSRSRTIMKRILNKYELQIALCDKYVKEKGKESLREVIRSKGIEEDKVNETIEMYDYYLEMREKIKKKQKKRDDILVERRKLLDDNPEYAEITQKLVKSNIKLANWIIRDCFKNVPLPKEEAQALALEGLSVAINRFDYTLGFKFSTYAFKVINNIIKRNFKSMMGVTWSTYCMKKNLEYWREELLKMDSDRVRPYSPEELANSGLVRYSVRQIRNLDGGVKVIYNFSDYYDMPDDSEVLTKGDMPVNQSDYAYLDQIDDNEGILFEDETMDEKVYYESLNNAIREVLGSLTEREQKILELRFGLNDGKKRTLEEVAQEFFVTYERIRQQEAKALRKCRHGERKAKLIHYAEDFDILAKSSLPDKIKNKDIIQAFMRLYELRKTSFPYSAKAFFISTRKLMWDEQEVRELDLLLDAFITNLQLGKENAYPVSSIVGEFCKKFSPTYEYKYPYKLIYNELEKRFGTPDECCFAEEVQEYLKGGPANVLGLALKNKC